MSKHTQQKSAPSSVENEDSVTVESAGKVPTVTIDGREYTLESLGEQGREQFHNLRVTDQELLRLQHQQAITQTARNTYARLLAKVLEDIEPVKH